MNVSSVKNLNGEVFSAVQDASLTNVVQTNSGNWQDITAYQNASATYLTAVDLTPYATTTEVDTLSSMLSGAIDYVSANAGDEFPVSADEAITAYQTNSGIYLKTSEFSPTIGRALTGDTFSLAVGSYSKSFSYGLGIGEYANRYVKNARSNAAIGYSAHAYGTGSQAFGEQVVVSAGMAIGQCNKTSACSFVIGNGTSNTARSDIFVINYDGSVSAAGKISANGVELGAGGGGASYTAGDNIDITNNVISVDDVSNLSAGDGINITQDASYTTISWLNDAGIKNVVYTASLPSTPDNNTLYLIPET